MTMLILALVAALWVAAITVCCLAQPRPAELAQLLGASRIDERVRA